MSRKRKPLPATREMNCRICGEAYVYPRPDENASRFVCANCNELPPGIRQTLVAMGNRIQQLENRIERVEEDA